MGNEPKSSENPLAEVAKAIGSTLGSAANRASELLRAATSGDLLPKARSSSTRKPAALRKAKAKAPAKKKSSSRSGKVAAGKGARKTRKPAARSKAK